MKKKIILMCLPLSIIIGCNSQSPVTSGGNCDTKEISIKIKVNSIDTIQNECTLSIENYSKENKIIDNYYYDGYNLPFQIIIKNNSFNLGEIYTGGSEIYASGSCPPLLEYEEAIRINGKKVSLLELYFSESGKTIKINYRNNKRVFEEVK